MSKCERLEREFLESLREGYIRFEKAHKVLQKLRKVCKDRQRLVVLEVSLDYRESRDYAFNMKRLYDEVIKLPVNDPETYHWALAVATKIFAYERTTITRALLYHVDQFATQFFPSCEHPDLLRWLSEYSFNMVVVLIRENELELARDRLFVCMRCAESLQVNHWWMPLVWAQASLVYAKQQDFESARVALQTANKIGEEVDLPWRLYAAAYLAYEEKHDLEETTAYLQAAYGKAREQEDYFLVGDILFLQACVYADSKNHAAFWHVYQGCRDMEVWRGVPTLPAFHTLAREIPELPRKEVIAIAETPSPGSAGGPGIH